MQPIFLFFLFYKKLSLYIYIYIYRQGAHCAFAPINKKARILFDANNFIQNMANRFYLGIAFPKSFIISTAAILAAAFLGSDIAAKQSNSAQVKATSFKSSNVQILPQQPTSGIVVRGENFGRNHHAPEQTAKKDNSLQGPFYFVDENPIQVIKVLEELTGEVAIASAGLPNVKINFSSKGKLPRDEAILALKSLLSANGMAVVPMGDKFFKVAAAQGVNTQAPTYLTGRASALPTSQAFYSKFYELNFVDVETLAQTLGAFVSPNNVSTLAVFPRSNAFFLTDTLANHQRIEMLLEKIDVEPDIREDIGFFMLKNVGSDDAKRRLASIQNDSLKKYLLKTSVESDERTNQLIVITPKGNLKHIAKIIAALDLEAQPLTKSAVFYIRHGESKDVATVLNQIVKGQQAAVKSNNAAEATRVAATNRSNMISNVQNRKAINKGKSSARPVNLQADPSGAALQFSEYVTIVADERSNSIVAYGTSTDLMQIKNIIEKVDIVLAQVKIDVIITEVTLTDKQVSGLSTFGLSYSTVASTSASGTSTTTTPRGWRGNASVGPLNDSGENAFSLAMNEQGFSAIFNVAEENSKVKILSAPSIVTTHNKEATINVSRKYPFITGTTTYNTGNYPSTQNTVDWRDIGIILKVTPLIGDNGVVQLKIEQTASSVLEYMVVNDTKQAIEGTRKAESFVSAKDGETIVLAGLQQNEVSDTDQAVWLLSDIPLLGELFKPTNDKRTRTELVIFIRPSVIKSVTTDAIMKESGMTESPIAKELDLYLKTGRFYDPKTDGFGQGESVNSSAIRTLLPKSKDEEAFKNPHAKPSEKSGATEATKTTANDAKAEATDSAGQAASTKKLMLRNRK